MKKILVIGDIMMDRYSYGNVLRLNPEGPAPLLNIIEEKTVLGGAANVSANVASLLGVCDLVGIIGDDSNAAEMKSLCEQNNINFHPILTHFPTITKQRFIDNTYKQQLLRVDYEQKVEISDEKIEEITHFVKSKNYDIIIISDYAKGIISKKLIEKIITLPAKILVDSKPKNYSLFPGVFLLKPNFKEFLEMTNQSINNTNTEIEELGKKFAQEMNTNLVITRGSKGATLITQENNCIHIPTEAKDIFDVTGAGDTFIATIAYALSQDYSLEEAIKLGNKASGIVIGKIGTTIINKNELLIEGKKK